MKTNYETGATSHAVNDLILFVDNTRELAAHRDEIYRKYLKPGKLVNPYESMRQEFIKVLQAKAAHQYDKEFNYDNYTTRHITQMTEVEINEFGTLYADDFEAWKKERSL